jgi:hypothetical protein
VGDVLPIGDLLAQVAHGVGADVRFTWADQGFLTDQQVEPWAGDRSVPLWLPRPEYDGMMAHDPQPSYDAGLVTRPVADTARDTVAWARGLDGDVVVTGLTADEEREVLTSWHTLHG